MRAHDIWRRAIDEIPVVDALRVLEIEAEDLLALGGCAACVRVADENDRQQPRLVPRLAEQRFDVAERQSTKLARDLSRFRHADAEELVAGAVLTRCGLEESLEDLRVGRISELTQAFECWMHANVKVE